MKEQLPEEVAKTHALAQRVLDALDDQTEADVVIAGLTLAVAEIVLTHGDLSEQAVTFGVMAALMDDQLKFRQSQEAEHALHLMLRSPEKQVSDLGVKISPLLDNQPPAIAVDALSAALCAAIYRFGQAGADRTVTTERVITNLRRVLIEGHGIEQLEGFLAAGMSLRQK